MAKPPLIKIYQTLLAAFGPRHWWPAKTSEEIIFGAILTQNTTWKNVKQAINALKNAGKLSFKDVTKMDLKQLAELIRPARFLNQKAKALKVFADYFGTRYNFNIKEMKKLPLEKLREELLDLYRIGPETADSILLYALEKPIFVIDAYTKRIFSQHGFMKNDDSYEAYQKFFMDNLPQDVQLYNEFHALIVHTGYLYCKPKPLCGECPLSHF
ncbi:MAG TPA: endonuclease III domain-containing protein [Thermodesulfobacteriota bacterium]|nr:endonuclease III domain-containing protein [Thermodesulfobacteriota bacterium]